MSTDSQAVVEPADQSEAILEAVGLCVGYGSIPVIVDMDLSVRPGEVVALLGANGAGKSTTLLALAGEIEPQRGYVSFRGDHRAGPLHKRANNGLGFVTEERSVFMQMTVAENLRLGRGSIDEAISLMPELKPLLKRRAGLLSGGEQQILTLARVLAGDCKVLLIDEISLGLAPIVVRRLLLALRAAVLERNLAVVLVEQHISNALEFSDRAVIMRRGRVVLQAESAELANRRDEIQALYL
jgi:branched-chain amino acid transport system ATP-binding protein